MKQLPIFSDFKKAVSRLEESLSKEKTAINRDSALMRFQMSFDAAMKTLKEYARSQGKECYVPKQCLRVAFQLGLIPHDTKWLDMVDDRNAIIHTYKESLAEYIYSKLSTYLVLLKSLVQKIETADV